ncbi:PDDEXK nuclease domain-containing protein [Prosthecobacter sp.]|uniref:PDDEXK nuclease domain-containing protein n=1 Tax=Prosthecobacter sp. TaxID=1965333 RepID=UPI002AB93C88|nr:PDDEXK nuclease domain-containing protein [Prosthecobacter sp.]MDZ4403747.1 PDDEXK nuclease domain-containing protein [Prosthecobacter sp.]
MAKKRPTKSVSPPTKRGAGYPALVKAISAVNTEMVTRTAAAVNQALVLRNWLVGAYIVEFEQNGADRAKYGARLLETLAADLTAKGIKGLGFTTLKMCRLFFQTYPAIGQAVLDQSGVKLPVLQTSQPVVDPLALVEVEANFTSSRRKISGTVSAELPSPLKPEQLARISWAHFLEFMRIDDPWQRAFYENELLKGHWSQRQLQRQIGSLLYERTGLSTDKKAVIERARRQEPRETIADMLRDPYVLEFTGLAEMPSYSEDELEAALLDHLQRFLLELGQGFCFEARQFRMTEGRRHHRVDLVFYHRILRCHVLIDLKIRHFKPEDAGQMNFYVNWFKANMTKPGDNPPVGILLCSDRDGAEVEFATAGMDNKLFVSRYLKALPSAEQLKAFLERDRAEIKTLTRSSRAKD